MERREPFYTVGGNANHGLFSFHVLSSFHTVGNGPRSDFV